MSFDTLKAFHRQHAPLHYSMRRGFVDAFFQEQVTRLPNGTRILDLGGNKTGQRGMFNLSEFEVDVTVMNIVLDKGADVQADGVSLPFVEGSFDVVICAEVLEHVPYPAQMLSEIYRVLGKDGALIATVPFNFRIHGDPYDYGRYTDTFWVENLNSAGFSEVDLEHQGAFWSVWVDMIRDWAQHWVLRGKPKYSLGRKSIRSAMRRLKQCALDWDEQLINAEDPGKLINYTTGFGIRAVK